MPTTSNFGWTTPADTDLVKDGALAIRTLGNGIDTSLVDLKGGTTGQILSKASNTDLDYTWINNDTGDITGVTAGTGISGGGTSGTVTITNSMATEITAAGDIIVGTGSGTFDNLPIGTTGQVLTADTTVSPYKVKWASASSTPTFVGCRLYSSATQNLTNNTATAINFDLENFDSDGFHSTTTNNTRITIPTGKAGKYLFTGHGEIQAGGGNMRYSIITKNGTTNVDIATAPSNASARANVVVTAIADCAAGDYFELVLQQDSGGTIVTYPGTSSTSFGCTYLGA